MKRHVELLMVVLLLLTLALPLSAQEEGPPRVGLRPDAPEYALHGPYWVGTTELLLEDDVGTLTVTAWYPALNPDGKPEDRIYAVELRDGRVITVNGRAIADAPIDSSGGPYPLVILSHAGGWMRVGYTYYMEHLASYGLVVLSADHSDGIVVGAGMPQGLLARSRDIMREIAFAEALTAQDGMLEGMIDTDQVGVVGHSQGGITALAAVGGRINLTFMREWCEEHSASTSAMKMEVVCPFLVFELLLVRDAGLNRVPDGPLPAIFDPRVDAAVSIGESGYFFGPDGLKDVRRPTMVVGGTLDDFNIEPGEAIWPAYEWLGSSIKARLLFENGGHMMFGDDCNRIPWFVANGWYSLCSDSVWDMDRAHDLTNHFTTAFLLDVLKGDEAAHAALAPDTVSFPGITYEAEGF